MTLKELYAYLIENYGTRGFWISDLARELNISSHDANYLTLFLGYKRGKEVAIKTEMQFSLDAGVKRIQALI